MTPPRPPYAREHTIRALGAFDGDGPPFGDHNRLRDVERRQRLDERKAERNIPAKLISRLRAAKHTLFR